MKAVLSRDTALRFIGENEAHQQTLFDTSIKGGGLGSAPSPMEITLQAAAACTSMDVIPILEKRRKTIDSFSVELDADRAADHPKVFTRMHMTFHVTSPDITVKELTDAIVLSKTKYCSVSIMLARSGCDITWSAVLKNTASGETLEFEG